MAVSISDVPLERDVAPARLRADDGTTVDVPVRYALHGEGDGPLRVVLGGISARRELTAWWPRLATGDSPLFDGGARVLGIDWVTGLPEAFRGVAPRLQALAVLGVLDHLQVECIDAIVGASYGGAVALAFASLAPARCRRALVLCAAHRPSPMSVAQRALQRSIIRLAYDAGVPGRGVAIARALAMTTYRTEAEFAARFAHPPRYEHGRWRHAVEDYLDARGAEFATRFDAARYLELSESLDLHAVEPSSIRVPLDLLAVREDRLVPLAEVETLAAQAGAGATLHRISSIAGHDGFITETDAVTRWLRDRLSSGAEPERMRGVTHTPFARPDASHLDRISP